MTVNLYDGEGTLIDTRVTDEQGQYFFTGLPPGIYGVVVDETTLPEGMIAHPNGDPDYRDGIGFGHDNQTTVTLGTLPGGEVESNLNADFAYLPPEDRNNAIGDRVWLDQNSDGVQDPEEPGIPNVTVVLLDSGGEPIATEITDENGEYLFIGLPDGEYTVVVVDPENVLEDLVQTYDADGVVSPNQSYLDLDSADLVETPVIDVEQDFGYTPIVDVDPTFESTSGVIGDTVFFDSDSDGERDPGESGIEGVTVELRDGDGNLIDVATTDENGNYLFTGLEISVEGTEYSITVRTDTLPGGGVNWSNTFDPDGSTGSTSTTVLTTASPVDISQDYGYGGGSNSLGGTLWPDTDKDGEQDDEEDAEGGFEGITVLLLDAETGNIVDRTVTDEDGGFEFTGLPDGQYTFLVTDDDRKLVGYEHTDGAAGQDRNSQRDDGTYIVDLDSAGVSSAPVNDETSDAGYTPTLTTPITLGSFASEALSAGDVRFSWTTHSEVANVGFMIYQNVDGDWRAVNDRIIPAVGESLEVQSYEYIGHQVDGSEYVLVDVDTRGQQTLHGPFVLGEAAGVPEVPEGRAPDWDALGLTDEQAALRREAEAQRFKSSLDAYLGR